jgi:hypothetical protein
MIASGWVRATYRWVMLGSLDYLSNLEIGRKDHLLGLQLGEIQLSEPFLPDNLKGYHLTGRITLACLPFCVSWI